jgi:hypothetical protein
MAGSCNILLREILDDRVNYYYHEGLCSKEIWLDFCSRLQRLSFRHAVTSHRSGHGIFKYKTIAVTSLECLTKVWKNLSHDSRCYNLNLKAYL